MGIFGRLGCCVVLVFFGFDYGLALFWVGFAVDLFVVLVFIIA